MVPRSGIELTISETIRVIKEGRPGDLAEFGIWMGGASFAMLLAQRKIFGKVVKPVWMFDSFQGLPPAGERDGSAAVEYQKNVASPKFYDNCAAPLERVKEAKAKFGFGDDEAIIVPGWFSDTIPAKLDHLAERGIALLRIDCDWYEPVKLVLDQITPIVADHGSIILDDYYTWDGCSRATHDYLSENKLPYRIRSNRRYTAAYIIKDFNSNKPPQAA
jgi:hypothetical protein